MLEHLVAAITASAATAVKPTNRMQCSSVRQHGTRTKDQQSGTTFLIFASIVIVFSIAIVVVDGKQLHCRTVTLVLLFS